MEYRYPQIRPDVIKSLQDYAFDGVPTGDFLRAVLENDLMEAFGRADDDNTAALRWIVSYVYNELPAPCHGSPENVSMWLERFRLAREDAATCSTEELEAAAQILDRGQK